MNVQLSESDIEIGLRHGESGGYNLRIEQAGQINLNRDDVLLGSYLHAPFQLGVWTHVRLSAIEDQLRVSIDGIELMAVQDSTALPAGNLIISASQTGITLVDQVRIWVPEAWITPEPSATVLQSTATPSSGIVPVTTIDRQHLTTGFEGWYLDLFHGFTSQAWQTDYTPEVLLGGSGMWMRPDRSSGTMIYRPPNLKDLKVAVKFAGDSGRVTINLRESASGKYAIQLDFSGIVAIYKNEHLIDSATFIPEPGLQNHHLDLIVSDNVLSVMHNGIILGTFQDEQPLPAGNVSIHHDNVTQFYMDSFQIWLSWEDVERLIEPVNRDGDVAGTNQDLQAFSTSNYDEFILFSSYAGSGLDYDLYVVDPNNCTNATNCAVTLWKDSNKFDQFPAWSPDRSQVAYISDFANNNFANQLYVMDGTPSAPARLIYSLSVASQSPAWSPDGNSILFSRSGDIYLLDYANCPPAPDVCSTVNLSASNPSGGIDAEPVWTSDGLQIIFSSDQDGDFELFRMNSDGSNREQLTFNTQSDTLPDVYQDQVAFRRLDAVYVLDLDTGTETLLANQLNVSVARPSWSPDGEQVVIQGTNSGSLDDNNLLILDAVNGQLVQVAGRPQAADTAPDWGFAPEPVTCPVATGLQAQGMSTESCPTASEGIYTVNSDSPLTTNSGDGVCTLTDAILYINGEGVDQSTDCNLATGSSGYTIEFDTERTITIESPYAGVNGLPIITADVTIDGKGSTIRRGSEATAFFRFFEVPTGKTLELKNLTLTADTFKVMVVLFGMLEN